MLAHNQNCRHLEDTPTANPAHAVEPAYGLEIADLEEGREEAKTRTYGCAAPGVDPDQASKFIKGLTIALPLSISLWALMIMGIRAIW